VSFADDRSTGRLDHAPQRTVLLTGHCSQGDERLLRPFAVALLKRWLQNAQIQHVLFLSLHWGVVLVERFSLVNRNVYRIGCRAGSVEPIEGDTCQRDVQEGFRRDRAEPIDHGIDCSQRRFRHHEVGQYPGSR